MSRLSQQVWPIAFRRRSSIWKQTAALSAALLITILFFWKLTLTNQFTWLNSPDLANQVLPWFQFQARSIQNGEIPIWDPYHWGGQSLIGQMQPGSAYPLNWLLFLAPLDNGYLSLRVLNFYFVLIHYLGVVFAYLLCRDLGRSRIASLLGGIGFGFGGYVGLTDWPQMINGAIWIPLGLLLLLRAIGRENWALWSILTGACYGVSWMSGHHQIPMFFGVWLLFAVSFYTYTRVITARRAATILAILGLTALLVASLQLFPAYSYWHRALRWVGAQNPVRWDEIVPYTVHAYQSLNPVSIIGIFIPGIFKDANPFSGFVPLVLAAVAVATVWRRKEIQFFSASGILFLLFSLGGNSVLHGVLYAIVPGMDKARSPYMGMCFFHASLVVLAAFGLDVIGTRLYRQRSGFARVVIRLLTGTAAIICIALFVFVLANYEKAFLHPRPVTAALVCVALAGLLAALRYLKRNRRILTVLIVGLMLFELGTVTGHNYVHREHGWQFLDPLWSNSDLWQALKSTPEFIRVGVDRNDVPFNFGDWHGIEQFGGYAGVTENIINVNGIEQAHLIMGENRWIGRGPRRPEQALIFESKSGLKLYRDPDAFPRVWTVHEVYSVPDLREAAIALSKPLPEHRSRAFVAGAPPSLAPCSGDRVVITKRNLNLVSIRAEMNCTGMVILGDTYDPDWRVYVDGKQQRLYAPYSVARGVVVDSGVHEIVFRYAPLPVYLGALGSATGIGIGLAAAALLWRKRSVGCAI